MVVPVIRDTCCAAFSLLCFLLHCSGCSRASTTLFELYRICIMFYRPVGSFLLPLSHTHGVLSSLCFPGYSCVFIFLTCHAPFKSSLEVLLELHSTCKLTGRTDIWRTSRHPNQNQEMLFPLFNYSAGFFFSFFYVLLSLHCLISKGDRVFFVCPFSPTSTASSRLAPLVQPTCTCLFHSRTRTFQLLTGVQSFHVYCFPSSFWGRFCL